MGARDLLFQRAQHSVVADFGDLDHAQSIFPSNSVCDRGGFALCRCGFDDCAPPPPTGRPLNSRLTLIGNRSRSDTKAVSADAAITTLRRIGSTVLNCCVVKPEMLTRYIAPRKQKEFGFALPSTTSFVSAAVISQRTPTILLQIRDPKRSSGLLLPSSPGCLGFAHSGPGTLRSQVLRRRRRTPRLE